MKLSPQQIAAAKLSGFVLFPASQSQIDRMTMQRRIFDVGGRPHVVSRDGVYFETHGTLTSEIADAMLKAPPEAEPAMAAPEAPVVVAEPVAESSPAAEPAAEAPAEEPAPARAPRRRLTRPKSETPGEPGGEETPARPLRRRAMAANVASESVTAEVEPAGEESASQAARRRAWTGEAPRWQVAGALRRGRQPRA